MKKILTLALLTFIVKAYSQTANTKDFKKVVFTYSTKSNCEFDDKGIYADSLLFKIIFPKLSYTLRTSPKDKTKKRAFIPYFALNNENKSFLRWFLYHSNYTTESIYDTETKKTELYAFYCPDEEFQNLLVFLEGSPCNRNRSSKGIIDYSDGIHIKHRGSNIPKKEIAKSLIIFQDSTNLIGKYDINILKGLRNQKYNSTQIVEFDQNLIKYITPIDIFANSDFGVKKVSNSFEITELTSVTYE